MKNQWFHKQRGRKTLKNKKKNIGFNVKPVPATASHQPPAPDSGSGPQTLDWRNNEEPLQPSCLGKYTHTPHTTRTHMHAKKRHTPTHTNTRLEELWGTLTAKLFREKSIRFTVFSLTSIENHWFYYVFAQKYWKSIGFTVFSLKKVEKALVLLCFRSKRLKKHWFYCVFAQKCWKK